MTPSFRLSNCFALLARIAIHARGNQCTTNDIALLARVATHARGNQHTASHIAASAKWIQKTFHLSNHFALLARITSHARGNQYTTNDIDLLARIAIHACGNQHITNDIAPPAEWIQKPLSHRSVLVGINTWARAHGNQHMAIQDQLRKDA